MLNPFRARYSTYMRAGYRWHELKLTRRRYLTWQVPFTRQYSIAWTQSQIDKDVERADQEVTEFNGKLVGKAEVTRRFQNEERYDGG